MTEQTPSPIHDDAGATVEQLLARAAADLATQQTATRAKEQQGGPETRQGVLPGGGR